MPIQQLKDLDVYRLAREVNKEAYTLIHPIPDRDYKSQMIRSGISAVSNIAERYGRFSQAEFAKFLTYSSGSVYELRSQFEMCVDVGFLEEAAIKGILLDCDRICAMEYKLIQKLRS